MRTDEVGETLLNAERLLRGAQGRIGPAVFVPELGALVTAQGNDAEAIHRWFPVKEAFSYTLPVLYLERARLKDGARIHDPFSGSGTTAVSAANWLASKGFSGSVSATEVNPFLARLTRAKLSALFSPEDLRLELRAFMRTWSRHVLKEVVPVPESTTLSNPLYMRQGDLAELSSMVSSVKSSEISGELRDILLSVVAASVEPAARLRKDGRALRFVPSKIPVRPLTSVLRVLKKVDEDLSVTAGLKQVRSRVDVHSAVDAIEGDPVSYFFFSPPYPNNIDYTEVYKMENWVLGEWSSAEGMLAQRRRTLRSHPTVASIQEHPWAQGGPMDMFIDALVELIPANRYSIQRERLIRGYAADMYRVMVAAKAAAHSGSLLTFVVGNSLHGGKDEAILIPSDIILTLAGEEIGWSLQSFEVARYLKRRHLRSEFLRESVVTMRA